MKHTARKRFGQHFLTDDYVLGAIVDLIDPQPGQALVEIGPGLGALTWPVLQRCGALTVIELDRDLATRLRRRDGLTVIEADVLQVDFDALRPAHVTAFAPGGQFAVQHLDTDTVSLAGVGRSRGGPALHAAEGSRRPHGRSARRQGLRQAVGDAAVALPHRHRARSTTAGFRAAAAGGFGHRAHATAACAGRTSGWRCCRNWCRWPFPSGASCCAIRSGVGWKHVAFAGDFDVQRRAEEVPVAQYVALAQQLAAD